MRIFKLFACCIPVKGVLRNVICDVQRNTFIFISDGLYEILTLHRNKTDTEIKMYYEAKYHNVIDEYFKYLVDGEYGFYCSQNDIYCFPDLDLKFESPEIINNAIIDIDSRSTHNYKLIFNELNTLGCKYIELRHYDILAKDGLIEIMNALKDKKFRNICVYLKYYKKILKDIKNIIWQHNVIGNIIVHSSPKDKSWDKERIRFVSSHINSSDECGKIGIEYFSINLSTFSESQHYNSCLNKKVSIDVKGNIKNCPSLENIYGNINNGDSLIETVKKDEFKSFWSIHKGQVESCNVCEFRYICTDCRAFLENIYDKPLKCNYDPYLGKWN